MLVWCVVVCGLHEQNSSSAVFVECVVCVLVCVVVCVVVCGVWFVGWCAWWCVMVREQQQQSGVACDVWCA